MSVVLLTVLNLQSASCTILPQSRTITENLSEGHRHEATGLNPTDEPYVGKSLNRTVRQNWEQHTEFSEIFSLSGPELEEVRYDIHSDRSQLTPLVALDGVSISSKHRSTVGKRGLEDHFLKLGDHILDELQVHRMIYRIADRFFPKSSLLVLAEDDQLRGTLRSLQMSARWLVINLATMQEVERRKFPRRWPQQWLEAKSATVFVVISRDWHYLEYVRDTLSFQAPGLWNSTALILFALPHIADHRPFLKSLLAMRIVNLMVAQVNPWLRRVDLLSSGPQSTGVPFCQRDVHRLTWVDTWLPLGDTFLRSLRHVFVPPDPEDCRRCPVIASAAVSPPSESLLYDLEPPVIVNLLRETGCNIHVNRHNLSEYALDEVWHGSFNHVYHGEADVVVGVFVTTLDRSACFSGSQYVLINRASIYVSEMGTHLRVFMALELLVVAILVMAMAANHWLQSVNARWRELWLTQFLVTDRTDDKGNHHQDLCSEVSSKVDGKQKVVTRCKKVGLSSLRRSEVALGCRVARNDMMVIALLRVWTLYTDQPATTRSRRNWNRFLLASLMMASVTINAVRRSTYASTAMRPHYSRMHTIEEVLEADIPIGVEYAVHYATTDLGSLGYGGKQPVIPKLLDCFTAPRRCIERLVESRGDFALLASAKDLREYVPVESWDRIWPLEEPNLVAPSVVYFAKQHPLLGRFNRLVNRMHAAGLVKHLKRRASAESRIRQYHRLKAKHPEPLGLEELGPIFQVLACYLLPLSVLCFAAECALARRFRRSRSRELKK